ncbi:MAG: DinB family protein [Zunongwangia sp.]|uniref:DinB family protein n=1 Tax=Zunongwangia sp. TaxID=1965325 RepID=UPI003241EC60
MKIKTESLILDLIERTRQNINQVEQLSQLTEKELNKKKNQVTWSILECIEHLNLYGEFYIPEIEQKIEQSKTDPDQLFKSGVLGNYFAKSMLPSKKMRKIKTFKDKNPNGRKLNKRTLKRFLEQQKQILELLNKSRKINLNKTKTAISISKLLKLKLGNTFRVLIYHNQRHIEQAKTQLNKGTIHKVYKNSRLVSN